jgi:tetratricopeptide (TPR) repeat protein
MTIPEPSPAPDATPPRATVVEPPRRRRSRAGWWIGAAAVLAAAVAAGIGASRVRWTPATLERAESLLAEKKYRPAADEAEAFLAQHPDHTRALFTAARARAGAEDWAGCAATLHRVPDWSQRKAEALLIEGKALRKIDRGRDAERAYRDCIARDPEGPFGLDARLELMKLLALEERVEAFKAVVGEVLPRMPEDERLLILAKRMQIEFEQSEPPLNVKATRALLDKDPGDAYARAGLAAALDRSGDLAAARALYARAVAEAPEDAELRERYMDLLHRAGDTAALKATLAGRPAGSDERPNTRKFLGIVAESDGDHAAAERHYARAIAADPTDPELHHRRSLALYRLGRRDEARAEAAERARLNQARDDLRKAWDEFATPFESHPDRLDPALLRGMARACEACGWPREASAWYRAALRTAPDDAEARAGLERVEAPPRS